ncbi:phage tail sheath family protein [Nitrospira sp. Nam80]
MALYRTPGVYFERRDVSPLGIGLPRTDIAGFAGITMRGPLFTPAKIESWTQFVSVFGDFIPQGYLAYAVYGFFANGGRTCWVSRVADPASAQRATGQFGGVAVSAGSPGTWGNTIRVRPYLIGNDVSAVLVRLPNGTEQFLRSPFTSSSDRRENLFNVAQGSLDPRQAQALLVSISVLDLDTSLPQEGFLSGGADGLGGLKPEHFEQAFDALSAISEIGIVAAPDLAPKIRVTHKVRRPRTNCCENQAPAPAMERQDSIEFPPSFSDEQVQRLQLALAMSAQVSRYRFAILDIGEERADPSQAIMWRKALPENSFSAFYYPWILVDDDPLRLTGPVRAVPPSGHIAGVYARSDQRKGVHKPPMNEVLEEVSDVSFSIDDADHGELNENNINAIRAMPGRGVRVMGARTLWSDIFFRYINVRRLLSMIEKGIEQSLIWTVFEPNNPRLWSEIDRIVRGFLEKLFRQGMLDGRTSEEAYFVRCDEKTNPSFEADLGRVLCEIGVQPPYPAEFVVVTIGITRDGILVQEGREQHA